MMIRWGSMEGYLTWCPGPNDPHHIPDEFLRRHFRQLVLANTRGVGEPISEHDFVGEDMIAVISREKYGKERLEMEVAARWGVVWKLRHL